MYKGKRILMVDDDKDFRTEVGAQLTELGYQVFPRSSRTEFIEGLNSLNPDLALIDRKLGFDSGTELIETIRNHSKASNIPIIMITGTADADKKIEAITIGADDLITKPLCLKDLQARIIASLRRCESYKKNSRSLQFEDIQIDTRTHNVFIEDNPITLTNTEYRIFFELASNRREILSRERIAAHFLSPKNSNVRTLDVHINSLRKKLGSYSRHIKTIRGRGYMLD